MEAREEYLLLWLTVQSIKGLGYKHGQRLLSELTGYVQAAAMTEQDWRERGAPAHLCTALVTAFQEREQLSTLTEIKESGVQFVSDRDSFYPPLLREIAVPPPILYYHGTLPTLTQVGIVGTRSCSAYGRKAAYDLASELARCGIGVVSGLAYGVDKAAHEGALGSAGITVAVLGSGVNCIYPREHSRLATAIVSSGGCVISEFLPFAEPRSHQFPQRNRIVSGLAKAVVVVEAGERSGALITADFALEQDREVLAVPGSIYSDRSRGTNALIAQGARPVLAVADVLAAIAYPEQSPVELHSPSALPQRSKAECHVLAELSVGVRSLGDLQVSAQAKGMSRQALFEAITALELASLIVHSDGVYALR